MAPESAPRDSVSALPPAVGFGLTVAITAAAAVAIALIALLLVG